MKKLMTMLATAATALGLYAAHVTQTSFEDPAEFDGDGNLVTNNTAWSCTDAGATLKAATYASGEAYDYTAVDLTGFNRLFDGNNTKNLSVKTTFGKPLVHTNAATSAATKSVYVDQLVKFTAFDEEPTAAYADAKILVFARDLTEAEGSEQAAETNLYVKAGYWDGADKTGSKVYKLGAIDVDAWHRLTIKAIKADASNIGFEIYVDGIAKSATEAAVVNVSEAGLETAARALNSAKKLFPALTDGFTLTQTAFDGQGAIDDITVTTDDIGAWAQDKNITLAWTAADLTALTYQVGSETPVTVPAVSAGLEPIPYESGMTLKVTPTFATNVGFDKITMDGATVNYTESSGTYTITDTIVEDKTYTIVSKDITPRIEFGGQYYATFSQVIAALPASGNVTLSLGDYDVNVGKQLVGDELYATEALFNKGCNVTIDLAGRKIIGTSDQSVGYVLQSTDNLTIVDTVGGGSVETNVTGYAGVVYVKNSKLTVSGGTFKGAVNAADSKVSQADSTIACAFLKGAETSFPLTLEDGYQATEDSGYWVVTAIPTATFTVTAATHADAVLYVNDVAQSGLTADVKVNDAVKVVATAKANYEYASVESPWTKVDATAVYTKTIESLDTGLGVTVIEPTAIVKTITYRDEDEGTLATVNYSVENYPAKLKDDYTKPGYNAATWTREGNSFTLADLKALNPVADVMLDPDFGTAIVYTITYNGNEATSGSTADTTFTVETTNKTVIAENGFVKTGSNFTGWNTAADGSGTAYKAGDAIPALADMTLFAQWESAGPTPVVPGGSTNVSAKDADEAISKVKVAVPQAAASEVDADVYDGYFTKTATDNGDGTWKVEAKLSDTVVKAETETVEIAGQLSTFSTGFSLDKAKVKAGLYYSLKAGNSVTGRTEGDRVLAKSGEDLALPAEKYTGAGFYQVLVNTAPKAE